MDLRSQGEHGIPYRIHPHGPPTHRAQDGFIFVTKSLRFRPSKQKMASNTKSKRRDVPWNIPCSLCSPALPILSSQSPKQAKKAPEWAKTAQRGPQDAPRGPRVPERSCQDAQDGLKTASEASKTAQEAPKRPPKRAPRSNERHITFGKHSFVIIFVC